MNEMKDMLIWGKDLYEHIKMRHILSSTLKQNYVMGLNGPAGIGKYENVKKISCALERTFIAINYADISEHCFIEIEKCIQEMINKPLLIYIRDTIICDYSYSKEVIDFAEEIKVNKMGKDIIFIFSSEAIVGSNMQINANFRVFRYGRLSLEEKIQYSNQFIYDYKNQLGLYHVSMSESTIKVLIKHYTKETGVKYLTVLIKEIYETIYYRELTEKKKNISIDISDQMIFEILGSGYFVFDDQIVSNSKQGIGMAYTKWGGILLPIQISISKGRGKIFITGNIGNIMKESIEVVVNYIKAHCQLWKIPSKYFRKNDIHISIYELSLYKDGASAGLAFLVKMICIIKKINFKDPIAFSGEISLEGRVLRIGGIKEKICSAQEHGFSKFVLPKQALPEYLSLSEELRNSITTYFIEDVEEIITIIEREKVVKLCKEY